MLVTTPPTLESLPNEILIQIFETFPTRSLLPLAAVSKRFEGLVSRLHYARLVEAAALQDHELILECYQPSAKMSTPYLFCDYLDTKGLADSCSNPTLGGLQELYSRFRPVLGEENRRPRARYPIRSALEGAEAPGSEIVSNDVILDSDELFSQLCIVINMVKVGPKRGMFSSCVNMSEGVIRVWRHWLSQTTASTPASEENRQQQASLGSDDPFILWVDSSKNVGLKFRVIEKPDLQAAAFVGPDDERPVSYEIEYEELYIRTNQLLRNMEKSEVQQVNHAGKPTVIASI